MCKRLLVSAALLGFLGGTGAASAVPTAGHAAVITAAAHVKKVHKKPHKHRRKHRRHHVKKA